MNIDPSEVHDEETLVRRIVAAWIVDGRVSSMAFRHTPQPDEVSVDRLGSRTAQDALDLTHQLYPDGPRYGAATLSALNVREVGADAVPAASIPNMWHAHIVPKLNRKRQKALALACAITVTPP